MSENAEPIIVSCADDNQLVDTLTIVIGVITVIGSVVAYFLQQAQDRKDAIEAKEKDDAELDRTQGLERVRQQLSLLIGPMHRLWKTQTTITMHYRRTSGHGMAEYRKIIEKKGRAYWMTLLMDDFLQPFIEDPHTEEALMYRNYVSRRLKPVWTRIRELVLAHMSDLADMPSQEEWLSRYTTEDLMSPHVGSVNINCIFDSYTAWTFEFDDIVQSWEEGDFRRMQPKTRVAILICNDLIDLLYERAKEKEARYNKHVSIHRNVVDKKLEDQIRDQDMDNLS
mmetsp:Transcript_19811/g.46387  ORF Transcript_19811/g.46387 Transcript_19811/m.46387 type:complete len:282 (+) Transcript_19811:138-983(+)|eukprot:CAMPEP_0197176350 /NCGR_PEP_ID=MMETSP1423-20130617/2315_1 /TAXON_ID=476441 /ORGANISM="Pseudo-nitzschia heimii, Strain UNC1101" /LENGTH=281 /DNA_ID=CAMNT_0042625723 /DNA_START=128 /DNA_END=973 /DNA_ORIENTATION=-